MNKPSEKEIQQFWTDNPMVHPGFDFDHTKATPEEIRAHEARIIREKGPHFQNEQGQLLGRFIDYPSIKGKDVLDVGYGVGWLMQEMAAAGAHVYGLDLSKSHYDLCSYLYKDTPEVQIELASAEKMPYEDNRFDFVVSYGVIHHAENDRACYDEMYRVLKPGGKAFVMLYRRGGPKFWFHKVFVKGLLKGGLFKHRFNLDQFIYSVTDAYFGDGAPISRHYTRKQIQDIFSPYSEVKIQVDGNAYEWARMPLGRLPLTNLLGKRLLLKLNRLSGAYWLINLTK